MEPKELKSRLPRNKEDVAAAKALVALGFPTVEPVLPQMLDWLKTIGSPVELVFREFFVELNVAAVPVVQRALSVRHDLLKDSIVRNIVARWPREAVTPLSYQLQALATGSGYLGTDLVALRLLVDYDLAEPRWLKAWSQFKVQRLRELLHEAESIDTLLPGEK